MNKQTVKIKNICRVEKGNSPISKTPPGKYPLVVTASNRRTAKTYQFNDSAVCIPIVSSTGHGHAAIHRLHFQDGKFALANIMIALIPKDSKICSPKFLFHLLNSQKDQILVPLMRGTANVSLKQKDISELEIILPNILKQNKIILTLENFYSKIEQSIVSQTRILNKLEKLRNIFLRNAFQGNLTINWRQNQDNLESKYQILEKIREERIKIQQKNTSNIETIDNPDLPSIPDCWIYSKFDTICSKITDGAHHSPKNTKNGDVPYITAKNVRAGKIVLSNLTYVSKEIHREIFSRCNPEKGDILYTKDGSVGFAAVNELDYQFSMLSSVALLKPIRTIIDPYFLMNYLNSPLTLDRIIDNMSGTAIRRIILKKIKNFEIAIPSIPEQLEIVKIVNQKTRTIDETYNLVKKNLDKLEELKIAFPRSILS